MEAGLTVLVTGGTGSLGKVLVPMLAQENKVRVISRGEHRQAEMFNGLTEKQKKNVDMFLGDVRDYPRLKLAMRECEQVYHLAAMKSVDQAEYNPNEAVKTNVDGTRNVLDACLSLGVDRAVFVSTDKAVSPVNIYGATKLTAEKLWIQWNSYSGKEGPKFNAVRYGNVINSQGSVLEKWKNGNNEITDPFMTRFWITQDNAAQFIVGAMRYATVGEIMIPRMKSTTIRELFRAACPQMDEKITGHRPGEKMHETLISADELGNVTEYPGFFVRWPSNNAFHVERHGDAPKIPDEGFTSFNAERFTDIELKEMIV